MSHDAQRQSQLTPEEHTKTPTQEEEAMQNEGGGSSPSIFEDDEEEPTLFLKDPALGFHLDDGSAILRSRAEYTNAANPSARRHLQKR